MKRLVLVAGCLILMQSAGRAEWTGAEFVATPVELNGHAGDGTSAANPW